MGAERRPFRHDPARERRGRAAQLAWAILNYAAVLRRNRLYGLRRAQRLATREPDDLTQLVQRQLESLAERVEVRHRGAITVEAEDHLAVVADDGEADGVVREDRDERNHALHRRAERVERRLRTGHVRDGEVEEPRSE